MSQYKAMMPIAVYVGATKRTYEKGDPIDLDEETVRRHFQPEWIEKVPSQPEVKGPGKNPTARKKIEAPGADATED